MITQIIKYYSCSGWFWLSEPTLSGCTSPLLPSPARWGCHLPSHRPAFGLGYVPSPQPPAEVTHPPSTPGLSWGRHGTKHQSWRAQWTDGLCTSLWTTETEGQIYRRCPSASIFLGSKTPRKRTGSLAVALESPSFRVLPTQMTFQPSQPLQAPLQPQNGRELRSRGLVSLRWYKWKADDQLKRTCLRFSKMDPWVPEGEQK